MSDKDRVIGIGLGGFTQPDGDFPCGAKTMAPYPEPVHWCCPGCKREIKRLLLAGVAKAVAPEEPKQLEMFDDK